MEGLIAKIKAGFSLSLLAGDPKKVKLRQLQAELYGMENQMLLLEETKAERQFKDEMQRFLMKQRILRMGYDSQEIFSVCDL